MNILFICKFNRFRSKVAENDFLDLIKKKKIDKYFETKGRGTNNDLTRPFMSKIVVELLKKKDIEVIDEKSYLINNYDIKWADKIIIVADNVNSDLFPKEKTVIFPIKDASELEHEKVRRIINQIYRVINKYVDELEKSKVYMV